MIDIRIATEPTRAEILSKILRNSLFTEFGVSISSIIPTTNSYVVRKAATGADILLIASQDVKGEDIADLAVGHIEVVTLPETDDEGEIKRALEEGVMKSAMQCMHFVNLQGDGRRRAAVQAEGAGVPGHAKGVCRTKRERNIPGEGD